MPAHALGRGARRLPGRPSEKHPVGKSRLAAAAALVSRSRLVIVAPPRQPRAIDLDVGVMHDFRVSRPEFHRPDVRRRAHGNRNHEGAKDIAALRRQHVRLRASATTTSGVPSCHASENVGSRRQICGIASHHPLRHPFLNRRDFGIRQLPLALEAAMARLGLPRRHRARASDLGDSVARAAARLRRSAG